MRGVQLVTALAFASCTERTQSERVVVELSTSPPAARDGRVVLITIDGARWQDVFEGSALMPRTRELVEARGVALGATRDGCGTVRTAGGSNVSLPGYLEIFTGHASRCLDNRCTQVGDTVLDDAARAGTSVASIGSWGTLSRAVSGGGTGVFVSAGRTWPDDGPEGERLGELAAAGRVVSPYPGYGDYRPDPVTAALALEYLRVARPALLHIGLCDTDGFGHLDDYGGYLGALRFADSLIGDVSDLMDAAGAEGEKTTIIVTPDHGRASNFRDHGVFYPEAARTFVIALGPRVPVGGVACPTRDLTLADIAPTIRVLMGLPRDDRDGAGRPIELIAGPAE